MARYAINDTTLTALGDVVRNKTGKLERESTVPVENPITYKLDTNNPDDLAKLTVNGNYLVRTEYLTIPGVYNYKIVYNNIMQPDSNTDGFGLNRIAVQRRDSADDITSLSLLEMTCKNLSGEAIIDYHAGSRLYEELVLDIRCYTPWADSYMNIDLTIYAYDENGDLITEQPVIVKNTMTPTQMIDELQGLDTVPASAFNLTGTFYRRFGTNLWNWFVNACKGKAITSNITDLEYAFYFSDQLEAIPFDLNCDPKTKIGLDSCFASCNKLMELPRINNAYVDSASDMFNTCTSIREIPEDYSDTWNWSAMDALTSGYSGDVSGCCKSMYSLRKYPIKFLEHGNPVISYSYGWYTEMVQSCHSLDEIINIPFPHKNATWTSNAFNYAFNDCYRLKNITFALQEDGTPYKVNWKNQKIDLGGNRYVGLVNNGMQSRILNYNSGITADKEVKDDATYQALKDDPDWWTIWAKYARYNKQSAINTLNSLPDASEYLATAGGTNTIVLPKGYGSATDGGNVADLTEEEIAVATAKGWTVSFY